MNPNANKASKTPLRGSQLSAGRMESKAKDAAVATDPKKGVHPKNLNMVPHIAQQSPHGLHDGTFLVYT